MTTSDKTFFFGSWLPRDADLPIAQNCVALWKLDKRMCNMHLLHCESQTIECEICTLRGECITIVVAAKIWRITGVQSTRGGWSILLTLVLPFEGWLLFCQKAKKSLNPWGRRKCCSDICEIHFKCCQIAELAEWEGTLHPLPSQGANSQATFFWPDV